MIKYGSTEGEVSACSAMAWMALRARSRTLASFLLESCVLRDSTVLQLFVSTIIFRISAFLKMSKKKCDRRIATPRQIVKRRGNVSHHRYSSAIKKRIVYSLCRGVVLLDGRVDEDSEVVGGGINV